MKTIELTQGKITIVDDDVYEWASKFKWYAQKIRGKFYAARRRRNSELGKPREYLLLHREIARCEADLEVDHQDGNGLNNQIENLRSATHAENLSGFRREKVGTTSKFRGVCWATRERKWSAAINPRGKKIHLGYFSIEPDAAHAYDKAALELFGEFAQLNFPALCGE